MSKFRTHRHMRLLGQVMPAAARKRWQSPFDDGRSEGCRLDKDPADSSGLVGHTHEETATSAPSSYACVPVAGPEGHRGGRRVHPDRGVLHRSETGSPSKTWGSTTSKAATARGRQTASSPGSSKLGYNVQLSEARPSRTSGRRVRWGPARGPPWVKRRPPPCRPWPRAATRSSSPHRRLSGTSSSGCGASCAPRCRTATWPRSSSRRSARSWNDSRRFGSPGPAGRGRRWRRATPHRGRGRSRPRSSEPCSSATGANAATWTSGADGAALADGLEFHHRHPFGFGGDHSVANVALVCRATQPPTGRDRLRATGDGGAPSLPADHRRAGSFAIAVEGRAVARPEGAAPVAPPERAVGSGREASLSENRQSGHR